MGSITTAMGVIGLSRSEGGWAGLVGDRSGFQPSLAGVVNLTQGDALGWYETRRWRWLELERAVFCGGRCRWVV
jgi:hypothetical protein